MIVKRIVSNITATHLEDAETFYAAIFGLKLVMDHGWIRTYSSGEEMIAQLSVASEGGSGMPVPDLSIEVDSLETALARVKSAKIEIEYGPVSEPWGFADFMCVTHLESLSMFYNMNNHWTCSNSVSCEWRCVR